MNRDTGGLVENQQVIILENDCGFEPGELPGADEFFPGLTGRRVGRKANLIASREPIGWLYSAPVDPDFALAQHPIDAAFGHIAQRPQQKIVNSLPHRVLDRHLPGLTVDAA